MSIIPIFHRYDTDDKELMHLQQILTKLLKEIDIIGAPFGHFPLLRFIAPEISGYKAFVETHQALWAFLKVSEHHIDVSLDHFTNKFEDNY